jgi:hypothetical protein
MLRRLAVVYGLLLVLSATGSIALAPAHAATKVAAQSTSESDDSGGDPTGPSDEGSGGETNNKGGSGQSDPSAETGADKGEEAPATAEAGPPWTYQMARLALGLLLLLGLGIFVAYRKLVMGRQRTA